MMAFGKTHDLQDLSAGMSGERVSLGGWIEDLRVMSKMTFLTLRDSTGKIQVIAKNELSDAVQKMNRQSVILVRGTVQETRARDFDFEVMADGIKMLSKAVHPLPIDPPPPHRQAGERH